MRLGADFSAGSAHWSAAKCASFARALKAAGITFVSVYLGTDWKSGKGLSLNLFRALRAEGIDLVFLLEYDVTTEFGGASVAKAHVARAKAELAILGVPWPQPVIYCTDTNATEDKVDAYYREIAAEVGVANCMCYGPRALILALMDKGLVSGGLEAGAWGGDAHDPRIQLWQHGTVTIDGTKCDAETAYADDFGQYPRPVAPIPAPTPAPGGTMQTVKAYNVGFHLYSWLLQTYWYGGVPEQPVAKNQPDILDPDCSGAQLEALKRAGADLAKLFGTARPAAQTFYDHCDFITAPATWNDYIFHGVPKDITHVIKFIPPDQTIQAGNPYPMPGEPHMIVVKHPVAWELKQPHVLCGRLRGIAIDPTPIAKDPHPQVPMDWLNADGSPMLKQGYVGYHSRLLHALLNQLVGTKLDITDSTNGNSTGPLTVAALKKFQVGRRIPATGKVDKATLIALIEGLGL